MSFVEWMTPRATTSIESIEFNFAQEDWEIVTVPENLVNIESSSREFPT